MNRLKALSIVLLLWAAIFIPGLGSTEIKGEEGRRILPAVTMLEEGNWLLPYVGGKPFLRKPPLINWLIAASFKLSGVRNEWTARLPSALLVLALASTVVALSSGRGWMEPRTGLLAAVFLLTQFGLLAKARFAGAEIEGIYVPLTGLAIVTWMAWWRQGRSPWLTWTVPFLFLGLAALAKGPSLHLLYFYAVVLASLFAARQWKPLWQVPHSVGVLLAAAIFSAWAVPFFNSPQAAQAYAVWKHQGIDRFTENTFDLSSYLLNIPRALSDLLPWILLLPVFARVVFLPGAVPPQQAALCSDDRRFLRANALAIGGCFLVLLLIPGVLPRYVLPLGVPSALLLALALQADPAARAWTVWHRVNVAVGCAIAAVALITPVAAGIDLNAAGWLERLANFDFSASVGAAFIASLAIALCAMIICRRNRDLSPVQLALSSGALCATASVLYATAAVRWINCADDIRPLAAQIDQAIPPGQRLALFEPGYLAAIFYLQTPYSYADSSSPIPASCSYVLVRKQSLARFSEKYPQFRLLKPVSRSNKQSFFLLQRPADISNDPALDSLTGPRP